MIQKLVALQILASWLISSLANAQFLRWLVFEEFLEKFFYHEQPMWVSIYPKSDPLKQRLVQLAIFLVCTLYVLSLLQMVDILHYIAAELGLTRFFRGDDILEWEELRKEKEKVE